MALLFVTSDKTGRDIRLTKERWHHITLEHPEITEHEQLIETLKHPLKIKPSKYDPDVCWYYKYLKNRKRYLVVSVKYLNGDGFIITAYFMRNIK